MCRELKPVNNLDELLYQFYVNLDSDCLFQIPTAKLERIWDIKILDERRLKPGQSSLQLWNSSDFRKKPYESEKDAFFVELGYRDGVRYKFRIIMTDAYSDKHATLFPDGNFPKLLPRPMEKFEIQEVYPDHSSSDPVLIPKKPGVYSQIDPIVFFWVNTDKARIIELWGTSGSVSEITVINGFSSGYFDETETN